MQKNERGESMKFSARLLSKIEPYFRKIAIHPFLSELADGVLRRDRFDFYLHQDVLYLKAIPSLFSLIGSRSSNPALASLFQVFSKEAVSAEDHIRNHFLNGKTKSSVSATPACREYLEFLHSRAGTGTEEECLAAILPCFWTYKELGRRLLKVSRPSNPYLPWIAMNASHESVRMTDQILTVIDRMGAQCSVKLKGLMERACERSSLYEWKFWDDSYRHRS